MFDPQLLIKISYSLLSVEDVKQWIIIRWCLKKKLLMKISGFDTGKIPCQPVRKNTRRSETHVLTWDNYIKTTYVISRSCFCFINRYFIIRFDIVAHVFLKKKRSIDQIYVSIGSTTLPVQKIIRFFRAILLLLSVVPRRY